MIDEPDYIRAEFDELAALDEGDRTPPVTPRIEARDRVVGGLEFLSDDPRADLLARWGTPGGDVAWACGESTLIVGPTGVGKTTLAHQLVAGLLGIRDEVLGLPVLPAERVGYLALDRPKQIRRAMRRVLKVDDHHEALKRLDIWAGPLPADVGKHPEILVEITTRHGWDALVIDSVKDLTARVADDESGSNVNRAMQMLVAEGIDVLAAHHQRKAQDNRKPTSLEDVYGSTWITAGAGSVLLLWGEAGSELVELTHLKQPADTLGPWKLEHDHHEGTTTIVRSFDAVAYLRHRPGGATLAEVAQAEWGGTPTAAQRKKTERRLRSLARRTPPLVHASGQERDAAGGFASARYYAADTADTADTVDTTVDTPPSGEHVDTPWTPVDDDGGDR